MAKEFKDYDKKYARFRGTTLPYEDLYTTFKLEDAKHITKWRFAVEQHGNEHVRYAVYHGEGAEEWQQFRVSLKGFTTQEKLYRLEFRMMHLYQSADEHVRTLEAIRRDNYIGALVRGGFLNSKYEVIK